MTTTIETFDRAALIARLANATRIYSGRSSGCRCGCRGTYSERGTLNFTQRITRMASLLLTANDDDIDDGGSYLNLDHGNDRALCAYFD